jgi:hypothetical protein
MDKAREMDESTLAAIGSVRLATILLEAPTTSACMRRRLQFELSAQNENVVAAVRKWMSEFREQTSFLDSAQFHEVAG